MNSMVDWKLAEVLDSEREFWSVTPSPAGGRSLVVHPGVNTEINAT